MQPVEALMTIGDDTYLMVESSDGQAMSMPDALGMTPPDHADFSGMTPPDGAMGDGQSDASAEGETTQRRGRGDFAAQQAEKTGGNALTKAVSAVKAWLYEGVNTDSQPVSGTLVKVETGMQNDDSVEILSGVSEGDVSALHRQQHEHIVEHDDGHGHDEHGRRQRRKRRKPWRQRRHRRRPRRLLRRNTDD